jgi:hypothetical protein
VQDRACGQCGGAIEDVDIDPDLMRPGQLSTGVSNRGTTAGQDGANNLHPGENAGDSGLGPVPAKVPSQGVGFGFSLDQLHQGGGIPQRSAEWGKGPPSPADPRVRSIRKIGGQGAVDPLHLIRGHRSGSFQDARLADLADSRDDGERGSGQWPFQLYAQRPDLSGLRGEGYDYQ